MALRDTPAQEQDAGTFGGDVRPTDTGATPRAPVPLGTENYFRIACWVLVAATALFALNHVARTVVFANPDDEPMMVLIFAALGIESERPAAMSE